MIGDRSAFFPVWSCGLWISKGSFGNVGIHGGDDVGGCRENLLDISR